MTSARILLSAALCCGIGVSAPLALTPLAYGQATPATKVVGVITAISGTSLTVKPDTGDAVTVTVGDSAHILRAEPGTKSLASATGIQFSDLAVGDRVLMAVHAATGGGPAMATTVVAMKKADVAEKQEADQADWQKRGVSGLVKSIDPAAGTLTIAAGTRSWTLHTTAKTQVRRYDAGSIQFADAKPSTLDQIHVGDQVRARGDHDPASTDVSAEDIVFGSFRNIAATVVSVDAASNTLTVNDLATKKPVLIHVSADSQLHKLPEAMAQALATRFKSGGAGAGHAQGGEHSAQAAPAAAPAGGTPTENGANAQNGTGPRGAGARNGDLSTMLQRTPSLALGDLKKGDAVMIVATQGASDTTAVILIAGVEPILSASPSASQDMLASWSVGGGGGEGEGAQ